MQRSEVSILLEVVVILYPISLLIALAYDTFTLCAILNMPPS